MITTYNYKYLYDIGRYFCTEIPDKQEQRIQISESTDLFYSL